MIDVHARSEKELEPRSVGTSAALGETPPIKLCGWQELTISCFNSFTKWSLLMWGYLQQENAQRYAVI